MTSPRFARSDTAALAVVLFAVALAWPHATGAQSTHLEAAIRAGQARAAARRGETDEAVRLYREAVSLGAPPGVLRDLAVVLEQQGRLRSAAGAWTRYAGMAPTDEEQRAAIARREALRRTPSVLRVRVSPVMAARSARVWFDRDPPRYVPVGGAESLVEGGRHRVRVESPGFAPWEMMVPSAFGESVEVVAAMRPDPSAARSTAPAGTGRTPDRAAAP